MKLLFSIPFPSGWAVTALLLICLQFSSANAEPLIHKSQHRYGPNLGHSILLQSPLGSELHVYKLGYQFGYSWIEPLGEGDYYTQVNSKDPYFSIRWTAGISQYYGQMKAELGLRAFPFLEFSTAFRHMQYFGSNLEMGVRNEDGILDIQDSWKGSYIYENAFSNWEFDYLQSFELAVRLSFAYTYFNWETRAIYSLVDVSNHHSGKNFDFYYEMPIYERDYFIDLQSDLALPIRSSIWDLYLEGEFLRAGWVKGDQKKQPLDEIRLRLGTLIHLGGREKRNSILIDVGMLHRDEQYLYDATAWDRVLLRFNWQYNHLFGLKYLHSDG